MSRLEDDLRALLADRAGSVTAAPDKHGRTLRRARSRRRLTAGAAVMTIVAFVAGSLAIARSPLFDTARVDPAEDGVGQTTTGPYGFTSRPGTGRVIAEGTFKDLTWVLKGQRQRLKTPQDGIRLELLVEGDEGQPAFVADTVVLPGDDILQVVNHAADVLGDDAEVLFGATVPGIDSVSIDYRLALEPSIDPHRFTDYRLPGAANADYFIAFAPRGEMAWVTARNDLGIDLDYERLHAGSTKVPQIASGLAGEQTSEFERMSNAGVWWLEFRGRGESACLFFHGEGDEKCFARDIVDAGGPLLPAVFKGEDVLGVTAILGDRVNFVRLIVDGEAPATLPIVQPQQSALRKWPLRIVAVGLERETSGRLEAIGPNGKIVQTVPF